MVARKATRGRRSRRSAQSAQHAGGHQSRTGLADVGHHAGLGTRPRTPWPAAHAHHRARLTGTAPAQLSAHRAVHGSHSRLGSWLTASEALEGAAGGAIRLDSRGRPAHVSDVHAMAPHQAPAVAENYAHLLTASRLGLPRMPEDGMWERLTGQALPGQLVASDALGFQWRWASAVLPDSLPLGTPSGHTAVAVGDQCSRLSQEGRGANHFRAPAGPQKDVGYVHMTSASSQLSGQGDRHGAGLEAISTCIGGQHRYVGMAFGGSSALQPCAEQQLDNRPTAPAQPLIVGGWTSGHHPPGAYDRYRAAPGVLSATMGVMPVDRFPLPRAPQLLAGHPRLSSSVVMRPSGDVNLDPFGSYGDPRTFVYGTGSPKRPAPAADGLLHTTRTSNGASEGRPAGISGGLYGARAVTRESAQRQDSLVRPGGRGQCLRASNGIVADQELYAGRGAGGSGGSGPSLSKQVGADTIPIAMQPGHGRLEADFYAPGAQEDDRETGGIVRPTGSIIAGVALPESQRADDERVPPRPESEPCGPVPVGTDGSVFIDAGHIGEDPGGGQSDPTAEGGVLRSPRRTFPVRVSPAAKDVVGRARAASADQGAKRALPSSLLESPTALPPGETRHGGYKTGVADQINPSKRNGNMSVEKRSAFRVIEAGAQRSDGRDVRRRLTSAPDERLQQVHGSSMALRPLHLAFAEHHGGGKQEHMAQWRPSLVDELIAWSLGKVSAPSRSPKKKVSLSSYFSDFLLHQSQGTSTQDLQDAQALTGSMGSATHALLMAGGLRAKMVAVPIHDGGEWWALVVCGLTDVLPDLCVEEFTPIRALPLDMRAHGVMAVLPRPGASCEVVKKRRRTARKMLLVILSAWCKANKLPVTIERASRNSKTLRRQMQIVDLAAPPWDERQASSGPSMMSQLLFMLSSNDAGAMQIEVSTDPRTWYGAVKPDELTDAVHSILEAEKNGGLHAFQEAENMLLVGLKLPRGRSLTRRRPDNAKGPAASCFARSEDGGADDQLQQQLHQHISTIPRRRADGVPRASAWQGTRNERLAWRPPSRSRSRSRSGRQHAEAEPGRWDRRRSRCRYTSRRSSPSGSRVPGSSRSQSPSRSPGPSASHDLPSPSGQSRTGRPSRSHSRVRSRSLSASREESASRTCPSRLGDSPSRRRSSCRRRSHTRSRSPRQLDVNMRRSRGARSRSKNSSRSTSSRRRRERPPSSSSRPPRSPSPCWHKSRSSSRSSAREPSANQRSSKSRSCSRGRSLVRRRSALLRQSPSTRQEKSRSRSPTQGSSEVLRRISSRTRSPSQVLQRRRASSHGSSTDGRGRCHQHAGPS